MTPQEAHKHRQKQLELAEANTQDILERYDGPEHHQLTWRHTVSCEVCGTEDIQGDTPPEPKCINCKLTGIVHPYIEIVTVD